MQPGEESRAACAGRIRQAALRPHCRTLATWAKNHSERACKRFGWCLFYSAVATQRADVECLAYTATASQQIPKLNSVT